MRTFAQEILLHPNPADSAKRNDESRFLLKERNISGSMKKVSNKKIIRSLSWRTMWEKGWKNLIAVLAIALTTLLFTALFTVGGSMIESIQEATFRQIGTSAHGGYKYLSGEEYEKIRQAGGYEDISYDIIAGFGASPELNTIQTEVRYAEDKMAKWSFSYPEEGEMPHELHECAASSKVLEALGVPLRLGEKVPMTISTHDREGNERKIEAEFVLSGFWYSNDASHAQEFWVSRQWLEENIDLLEENYNSRMNERGLYHAEGSIQASIWFASSYDIDSQMEELTERAGFSDEEVRISVNWAYASATVDTVTLMLGVGILAVIILSGYLIIYNIFYINVTTDIRYYGLLKTIGTTGRQLRRMVRLQAFMLSAAGIPLGMIAGWFVGKGVLPALFEALFTDGVKKVSLNPWIFAGSALFSLLVVYLSCIRPCRLATGISPIEAVRYVDNARYKKKERKTAKVSMGRMALANMGRNRRKAVSVISSLSLSLILLSGTWCLVNGFSFDQYVKTYLLTDMQVGHFSTVNFAADASDYEAITPEVRAEIEQMPGVEQVRVPEHKGGRIDLSDEMIGKLTEYFASEEMVSESGPWLEQIVEQIQTEKATNGTIYHLGEDMMSYLDIKEGKFDPELFAQGGYALLLVNQQDKWVRVGDKLTAGSAKEALPKKELEIMAIADYPYAISTRSTVIGGVELLLSEKDFRELYDVKGGLYACLDVEEGREEEVMLSLNEMIEQEHPELVLSTKATLEEEFAGETRMFSMIGGLLSFILALIGILNLINAMVTSILSRRQEFAMMQAVGMTGRQLEQMLTMEGIWYGIWTLAISATFGNVVSYGLIYLVGKNMAYFEWHFSILPLALSVPVIGILSVLLPVICYHALCKKSIIERLRLTEV